MTGLTSHSVVECVCVLYCSGNQVWLVGVCMNYDLSGTNTSTCTSTTTAELISPRCVWLIGLLIGYRRSLVTVVDYVINNDSTLISAVGFRLRTLRENWGDRTARTQVNTSVWLAYLQDSWTFNQCAFHGVFIFIGFFFLNIIMCLFLCAALPPPTPPPLCPLFGSLVNLLQCDVLLAVEGAVLQWAGEPSGGSWTDSMLQRVRGPGSFRKLCWIGLCLCS